jgi:hypothetical protein
MGDAAKQQGKAVETTQRHASNVIAGRSAPGGRPRRHGGNARLRTLAEHAAGDPAPLRVRPQLEIGRIDAPEEREAEAAANAMLRRMDGATAAAAEDDEDETRGGVLRRNAGCGCAACSGAAGDDPLLRAAGGGSDPLGGRPVPAGLEAAVARTTRGGAPLAPGVRGRYEAASGRDLSRVRIHRDATAGETARALGARAYTVGAHVTFAAGQYAPSTVAGDHLLAHELAHVAQGGAVVRRQSHPAAAEASGSEVAALSGDPHARAPVQRPGAISRELQYLRAEPHPRTGANVLATLTFNTRLFMEAKGGQDDAWRLVVTAEGRRGWVPADGIATEPPEPGAVLYRIQPGETALQLAGRWYAPEGGWSRWWWPGSDDAGDARFYVGALAFANRGRAGIDAPGDLTERDAWMRVELRADHTIWKPSKEFLQSLQGRVSSGSITREAWEDVKSAAKVIWDFAVFAAAFISGVAYGAVESIYDLIVGVPELIGLLIDVARSIVAGEIIADAKAFWEDLKSIDVGALAQSFLDKWLAPDPWDAGFFQGRVLGYVAMEIVMAFASGGALTAIKWGGKFAKIGSLIAKLPRVARLADKVANSRAGDLARRAARAERRGGKASGGGETARSAASSGARAVEPDITRSYELEMSPSDLRNPKPGKTQAGQNLSPRAITPDEIRHLNNLMGQPISKNFKSAWDEALSASAKARDEMAAARDLVARGRVDEAYELAASAYNRVRRGFWRRVQGDDTMRQAIEAAGLRFDRPGTAPYLVRADGSKVIVTLEHLARKVDDPLRAVDPENLLLSLKPENTVYMEAIRRETRKALERVAPESGVTEWPTEDLGTTAERLREATE